MSCGTCSGSCCAVFTIADNLKERHADEGVRDGDFILDMLVPLTREAALERARRFGVPEDQAEPVEGWSPYTCRHWDEETRLCAVYETRPLMCRDYPYDGACRHGCDFVADDTTRAKWAEIRARDPDA